MRSYAILLVACATLLDAGARALAHEPTQIRRGVAPPERRAIYRQAPRFSLTTHEGGTFSLAQLRGKVVLVNFIYTTCPDVCPLLTSQMAGVQAAVSARGLGDRVHFLSITTDPAIDTPPVLREFGLRLGLDLANWTLLTGPRDVVDRVWRDFGVVAVDRSRGDVDHSAMTILLDLDGRQVLTYQGYGWRPEEVVRDITHILAGQSG